MLKEFLFKQMLKRQLAQLPAGEQERVMKLVEEHPELFKKIGEALQKKLAEGKDQMAAAMEIAKEFQTELAALKTQSSSK